jgi:large subunit ribosomal protein L6
MSRIGKNPIAIPSGVEVKFAEGLMSVKGPKGSLEQTIQEGIKVTIEDGQLVLERDNDSKNLKSMHGLYRTLVENMITGVSEGYKIQQELVGVGYKAEVKGDVLELNLGFSHDVFFKMPAEVSATALMEKGKNPIITLESHDKQLIGQVAAKIRSLRKPEPYKGKGIKFVGEVLRKKAGKSASK